MESVSCHGCELVTVGSLGSLCEEIGREKKRDDSTTAWNWAERFPSLDLLVLTMLSWDSPNICWQPTGEATLAWTKTPNTTKQAQWRSSVKLHKSCSSICTELIWTLFKCYHKKALFKNFFCHTVIFQRCPTQGLYCLS